MTRASILLALAALAVAAASRGVRAGDSCALGGGEARVVLSEIAAWTTPEWVELHNPTTATVDVGLWQLGDATRNTTVPAGKRIPPGGYLVLSRDAEDFEAAHGFLPGSGDLSLTLGNSADSVLLYDRAGALVDEFSWTSSLFGGSTAARDGSSVAAATPAAWSTAAAPGTPGSGPLSCPGEAPPAPGAACDLDACNGLRGEAMRACVRRECFDALHCSLGYDDTARVRLYNDVDNTDGTLRMVYGGYEVAHPAGGDSISGLAALGVTGEHTVPQSTFRPEGEDEGRESMRGDLHALFPAYSSLNSARSNRPFAEFGDADTSRWYHLDGQQYNSPAEVAASGVPADEMSRLSTGGEWMPPVAHRGVAARAVLYMYTVYEAELIDAASGSFVGGIEDVFSGGLAAALAWHAAYPPTAAEVARTGRARAAQGNPNPFVLRPEFAALAFSDCVAVPTELDAAASEVAADGELRLVVRTDAHRFVSAPRLRFVGAAAAAECSSSGGVGGDGEAQDDGVWLHERENDCANTHTFHKALPRTLAACGFAGPEEDADRDTYYYEATVEVETQEASSEEVFGQAVTRTELTAARVRVEFPRDAQVDAGSETYGPAIDLAAVSTQQANAATREFAFQLATSVQYPYYLVESGSVAPTASGGAFEDAAPVVTAESGGTCAGEDEACTQLFEIKAKTGATECSVDTRVRVEFEIRCRAAFTGACDPPAPGTTHAEFDVVTGAQLCAQVVEVAQVTPTLVTSTTKGGAQASDFVTQTTLHGRVSVAAEGGVTTQAVALTALEIVSGATRAPMSDSSPAASSYSWQTTPGATHADFQFQLNSDSVVFNDGAGQASVTLTATVAVTYVAASGKRVRETRRVGMLATADGETISARASSRVGVRDDGSAAAAALAAAVIVVLALVLVVGLAVVVVLAFRRERERRRQALARRKATGGTAQQSSESWELDTA